MPQLKKLPVWKKALPVIFAFGLGAVASAMLRTPEPIPEPVQETATEEIVAVESVEETPYREAWQEEAAKEPVDYIYETYLAGATLLMDQNLGEERIQMFLDAGSNDAYMRVFQSSGTAVTYADLGSNEKVDWCAFTQGRETWTYMDGLIEGVRGYEALELVEHPDAGKRVVESCQVRFEDYMARLGTSSADLEQWFIDANMDAIEDWALESLLETASPSVLLTLQSLEGQRYLNEEYLDQADLIADLMVGTNRIQLFEDWDATYLQVDQKDGSRLFFSDWKKDGIIDSFAVSGDRQTVVFEKRIIRLFKPGADKHSTKHRVSETLFEQAQYSFSDYMGMIDPSAEELMTGTDSPQLLEEWASEKFDER